MFLTLLIAAGGSVPRELDTDFDSFEVVVMKLSVIAFLVFLNGFFVASEFAMVKVRSSQLDALIDQGVKPAKAARHIVQHLDAYLSATQLGITLSSLGLGWVGEPFLARMLEPGFAAIGMTSPVVVQTVSFLLAFGVITFLHIVLGELAPKSLAIRRPVPVTLAISKPMDLFYVLFRPAIWILNGAANQLLRYVFKIEPVGETEMAHSEEELRMILTEHGAGTEESLGNEIVINALDLKHRVARDVMTPRGDVVFLNTEDSFEQNLQTALESQHTRFPLCNGHLDDAVGLVHIKDLLGLIRAGNDDLMSIKRELLHISEMMPIEKLLAFVMKKHVHLVVAVDEFGGTVGVVTMEDMLEELVGSIEDEFDTDEEAEIKRISEDEFDLEGSVPLHDLEEVAGIELESPDVTTIGGYVTHQLGHLPDAGESTRIDGYLVTVRETDGRRVLSLRFKRMSSEESELESEG